MINQLRKLKNNVFLLIRIALLATVAANAVMLVIGLLMRESVSQENNAEALSLNVQSMVWALIAFVLTFGTDYVEKKVDVDLPDILEIVIILFIVAGTVLSARFKLYDRFFWWDDMLHTLSGVIVGIIGFIAVNKISKKYSMNISPVLVALFSFAFAVMIGVVWEILEFSADAIFGHSHQKWNLPDTEILMGKPYQSAGLRDTMSDLILDSAGAFLTSVAAYFMYKKSKKGRKK
jgi:ammonia channel protein AmtB